MGQGRWPFLIKRDDIARATSGNDYLSDEGFGLEEILVGLEVDSEGAAYVAEQRASAAYAASLGKLEAWKDGERIEFPITIIALYMGIWMDGFAAGLRVKRLAEDDAEEKT